MSRISTVVLLLEWTGSFDTSDAVPYPWPGHDMPSVTMDDLYQREDFKTRGFDVEDVGSGPFYVEHIISDRDPEYCYNGDWISFGLHKRSGTYHFTRVCFDSLLNQNVLVIATIYWDEANNRFLNDDLGFVYGEAQSNWGRPSGDMFRSRRYPPAEERYSPQSCAEYFFTHWDTIRRNYAGRYTGQYSYTLWAEVQPSDPVVRSYSSMPEYNYWLAAAHHLPSGWTSLHPGLFSAAYYAAQDKLPQLLSNTFQNLIELGQTAISLANGIDLSDLKSIKRLAGNAWLQYRYQYNTTLSDLEELESTLERFDDCTRLKKLSSYGAVTDKTGTYYCCLKVDPSNILNRSMMKRLNLRPTLANAWDMIPYSFVVDWFTNISDVLHAIDRWLDAPSFGNVTCWYSFTTARIDPETQRHIRVYFRYSAGAPLLPYWSMDYSHKAKTWAMRATDVVSLLV